MTVLKRNKPLQIFLGVLFASLLLFAGYIIGEKTTFPETDFWNIAEPIILVAYMLIYMAFLSIVAIFSKSYDMGFLYYPAFAVCLTSVLSAFLDRNIEDSIWRYFMPLTRLLGAPLRAVAKAIEKRSLTYSVTVKEYGYEAYDYERALLGETDVIVIFLILTFISLIAYQLYTETQEHRTKKALWRLEGTARTVAIVTIIASSVFWLIMGLVYILPYCYSDILGMVIGYFFLLSTMFALPVIVPIVVNGYVFKEAISQARFHSNPRLYVNPLAVSALILSVSVSVTVIYTVLTGF